MATSSDEVANINGNIQEMRLGSVDDPLDDDDDDDEEEEVDEEILMSPQNMQNIQSMGNSLTFPRARRALTFRMDDESSPSSSSSSSTVMNNQNRNNDQPPSNAINTLHLEVRPQIEQIQTNNNNNNDNVNNNNQRPSQLYNWQGTKTTVKERFSYLFNNETLSDVRFLVGRDDQQQTIPAHKLILSAGSAVFDAMFNGTLATSSAEIEVPDVESSAFLAVLLFLYTDEIQIDPETVMTTLYTAKKYAVSPLEKHCVDFLTANLTSDNAFLLLTQARLFDEPQLASVCLDTIDKFTTDALNADGFTDIDIDTLMVVLERDTLRVRESKIFHAVLRWSESECRKQQLPITPENQRSVLGRALSLVRFPLMSVEEFAMGPAQCGLLTDREVVSLFLYFTVNPKPQVGFEAMPRCRMMGKELTVCRFKNTDNRWGYSGTSDKIRFSVDKRIFIVGYGVYGSVNYPAEYEVTIELTHTASSKIIASHLTSFSCDGSNYTYRLMFKEPIEIIANTIYTASATFKGPDSYYGTKGKRCVTVDCGPTNDSKVKFQFSFAAGDNNGTSVEDGQIPELIFYT